MKLSELLTRNRVVLPLEARDLERAVSHLARRLADDGALDSAEVEPTVRRVLFGDRGDLIRVDEAILVAAAESPGVEELTAAVGVSPTPFRVQRKGDETASTLARCLFLVLTPQRLSNLRVQAIPNLVRYLRDPDPARALLQAGSPDEVVEMPRLDEVEIHDRILVGDAMTPLKYRVYPDTPMEEVVDLMIRRDLHAVPVVGENHEVLGIITSGDSLEHLLPLRLSGEKKDQAEITAREVMTRSVLCVSEDQPLVEAANTLINKSVSQLPVVREGELVGFLTLETVLRHLFGR